MRSLFFGIGCLSASIGMIGIVVPVLPTTPFLILASLCFIRSSKRAYDYLLYHKQFGPYLRHYYTNQGVSKREKKKAYIFLWLGILVSIYIISSFTVKWILLVVAFCVTIHIAKMKTRMDEVE